MRNTLMNLGFIALAVIISSPFGGTAASAQNATYLGEEADTCAIFRAMSREIPETCSTEPVTRGLVTFVNQPPSGEKTRSVVWQGQEQTSVVQQEAPSDLAVAMKVHFEYNSDRLSPQAHQLLDKVGAVLSNDIMNKTRIRIEGHADQRGSEEYNMALSDRRARSV